jgi:transcriptional regulator with XRE-family HTH domain
MLMTIQENLKAARKRAGLTQTELAEKSGISFSYLAKLEIGAQLNPSYETLEKIATALNVGADELLKNVGYRPTWFAFSEFTRLLGIQICFDEKDCYLWVDYPNGTIEIEGNELELLQQRAERNIKQLFEDYKTDNANRFRPKKTTK